MPETEFHLNFVTSHGQFYINDKNFTGDIGSENFWTEKAFEDRLAVEKEILGISLSNDEGIVKCEIAILDSEPLIDFSNCDHVVEASLEIKSEKLQITDCPSLDTIFETKISNAHYKVRVSFFNIKSGYEEDPQDYYKIEIWEEPFSERIVLKRYIG